MAVLFTTKESSKDIIRYYEIEETKTIIPNLKSSVYILDAKFVTAVKDSEKSDNILAAIAETNGLKDLVFLMNNRVSDKKSMLGLFERFQ